MTWIRNLFGGKTDKPDDQLEAIQAKFSHFISLLNQNNRVLKIMSDMEEKGQGEFLFDINYISTSLAEIRSGVWDLIEEMIALGGDEYEPLRETYREIDDRVRKTLPCSSPVETDDLCIPFDNLRSTRMCSVGSKSAQLGEIKTQVGLPVPDGFAISGWAYKLFLDTNDLQSRIGQLIDSVDITSYAGLAEISDKIQQMVRIATVPPELVEAIKEAGADLSRRTNGSRFSLRSSAIGEDTQFSFAGQYATYLGVRLDDLVERYLEILASKFTPQAIYYYLSHLLEESDLAMSVGCVVMVDARSSGVLYTRDPVRPKDESILINAIFGLGKYVVDGTLSPDVFRVSREDGTVIESRIVKKPFRLVLDSESSTQRQDVPEAEQSQPSLNADELKTLTEYALKIEKHYGSPQDIEWAIDQSGKLFILQTRPLRLIEPAKTVEEPDLSEIKLLADGGITVCPGAGGGQVCHVNSPDDLPAVPDGAVVVAPQSFAGLITVMRKVHAIVTATGGTANHMATIAREYRIPTIGGFDSAADLPQGKQVTVDATNGIVYEGLHQQLIDARQPEYDLFDDMAILDLLRRVLEVVSPLNLIHPTDANFVPEQCRTLHDITRFCHQKAMDEMFHGGLSIDNKDEIGVQLESDIPLKVNIIYVDRKLETNAHKKQVSENDLGSDPMIHFWKGVKHEGWPTSAPQIDVKGFLSVLGTSVTQGEREDFSETSFAILSKEYMIISLRMGYHFTTVEAMCTEDVDKNYARMQYKEGGASMDRRERRIKLIRDILTKLGFEHQSSGDFLDTRIVHQKTEIIRERLFQLGRLIMLTKQLDMALPNDAVAKWYTQDIMKKLGLEPSEEAKL